MSVSYRPMHAFYIVVVVMCNYYIEFVSEAHIQHALRCNTKESETEIVDAFHKLDPECTQLIFHYNASLVFGASFTIAHFCIQT